MLTSITPLGERGRGNRYAVTLTAYVLGCLLGGATTGVAARRVGSLLPTLPVLVLAGSACLAAALADDARRLPIGRRQVDEDWLTRYRGWVYGLGFGYQLGSASSHRHERGDRRGAGVMLLTQSPSPAWLVGWSSAGRAVPALLLGAPQPRQLRTLAAGLEPRALRPPAPPSPRWPWAARSSPEACVNLDPAGSRRLPTVGGAGAAAAAERPGRRGNLLLHAATDPAAGRPRRLRQRRRASTSAPTTSSSRCSSTTPRRVQGAVRQPGPARAAAPATSPPRTCSAPSSGAAAGSGSSRSPAGPSACSSSSAATAARGGSCPRHRAARPRHREGAGMTATSAALAAVRPGAEVVASTLGQRAVDTGHRLALRPHLRRGFLLRAGLLGTALAVDPKGYVLRPGTAYAAVCGPGPAPPAAGRSSAPPSTTASTPARPAPSRPAGGRPTAPPLCGGRARYIIDCNATCATCTTPGARAGICSTSCWSCSCESGLPGSLRPAQGLLQRLPLRPVQPGRAAGRRACTAASCRAPRRGRSRSARRPGDRQPDRRPQQRPPAAGLHADHARYTAIGENGSCSGACVRRGGHGGGRYQRYERGGSPKAARAPGDGRAVAALRPWAPRPGPLGFPVTHRCRCRAAGQASRFGGRPHLVLAHHGAWDAGPIAVGQLGAEEGGLGFPTTRQSGTGRAAVFNRSARPHLLAPPARTRYAAILERYCSWAPRRAAWATPSAMSRCTAPRRTSGWASRRGTAGVRERHARLRRPHRGRARRTTPAANVTSATFLGRSREELGRTA
jgi:hypothetical protein